MHVLVQSLGWSSPWLGSALFGRDRS